MFCFKRIISLLSISLLFSTLSACKNKKDLSFLGVSKVEVTCNLFSEIPHLEIYLFSTTDYATLKVADSNYIEKVSGYTQDILLCIDNKQLPGYLHLFDITFKKEEFVLQEMTVLNKGVPIDIPIGMFQTIFLESKTMDISSTIDVYMNDDLTGTGLISFKNNLYTPIYYLEHKVVTLKKQQTISLLDLDRIVIYSDGIKNFDIFNITLKEKYHQVGGIVQTKFKTNLEEYVTYTTFYYSNLPSVKELSISGIDVAGLTEVVNS